MRHWLLTSTTYGTWLPGDKRGFVSPVRDEHGESVLHNVSGTPYQRDLPALRTTLAGQLRNRAIYFDKSQAEVVLAQFHETCTYRQWQLFAAAVMQDHFHAVLEVQGDPDPNNLLRDLKSYASRALNSRWPRPASNTWWTESGSKRKLPNKAAVRAAVEYVREQSSPLALWVDSKFEGNF